MILVDTNVLYALAGRRDKHHTRCAAWLQRTSDVLMIPATVLAETCYLIDRTLGPSAEASFLDSVGTGPDYTTSWWNSSTPTFGACPTSCASTLASGSAARTRRSSLSASGSASLLSRQ